VECQVDLVDQVALEGVLQMISIKNLNKSFFLGDEEIKAINNVSFNVEKGEYISIVGPSGSGKSTLMNILGLLDVPDSGEYILDGIDVSRASDDELALLRNKKIGFIFQSFNLLGKLTAIENVMVPLIYNGYTEEAAKKRAHEMLCMVGLEARENHTPNKLSGGQSQRVAIARALSCKPEILLADEPTGALDQKTGSDIMDELEELNKKGQTIILITHDINIASRAKRIVKIMDGKLYEEVQNDNIKKHTKNVTKKYNK